MKYFFDTDNGYLLNFATTRLMQFNNGPGKCRALNKMKIVNDLM